MSENKWKEFESKEYRIENLGRPAVFLIPSKKIEGTALEKELHQFLIKNFGAFTVRSDFDFGFWKSEGVIINDHCKEYEVSFAGKDRISLLLKKLTEIVSQIGEECIYVKAGQYAAAVYPKR